MRLQLQRASSSFDPAQAGFEDMVRSFVQQRFVYLPELLGRLHTAELLAATADRPSQRVRCGDDNVMWDEQSFSPGHAAYDFFTREDVTCIIQGLTGLGETTELTCWTSSYGAGEYIDPHCDSSGTIQLLVCLCATSGPEFGGTLTVAGTELFLHPGDAVVFEATTLEHSTSPLIPTDKVPAPRRTVLVGRYYLAPSSSGAEV